MTADKATTVPGGVDGSIKRIEKGYDNRGRLASVTSYNAATGGSAVNGVLSAYNDFDQVINEYQDHSGAASTSDPGVAYAYANGSANTIRLTTTTYPDGTAVTRDYGTANGINDLIDRVEKIKDGGTVVCSYRYLGVGTFVGVKYNAASNVELSFGTSSNNYSGLDAFGRVVENKWKPSGSAVQHSTYGYDETNKRLWRDNVLTSLRDSYYTYDGVNQLENWKLGNLNAGKTGISGTPAAEQLWEFDDAGNWADYKIKANGSLTLDQGRTHNKSNQITDLDAPASVIDPTYDAAGNTTKVSKPASWTSDLDLTWDAWNRLVEVDDSGTTTTFAYDGLFRRIKKVAAGTTHHYYYNLSWQIVEKRLNTSSSADRRWWWGMRNLNDLIRRQRPGSSETLYALDDAMNIVALVNSSAAVQQRMTCTPYGDVAFLTSTWGSSTNSYDWEYLYHGHYRDSQTGLYQMRYRYYHPLLGRWPDRDPLGEQGGLNLYGFVGNDPVNRWDPLGTTLIRHNTEYDTLENILSRHGNWAVTMDPNTGLMPSVSVEGEPEYDSKKEGGLCCKRIVKAPSLVIEVKTILPSDWGNPTPYGNPRILREYYAFTRQGYLDTIRHEWSRLKVYRQADRAFLQPAEKSGRMVMRCEWFCRAKMEEAEEAAATYISNLQSEAIAKYNEFVDRHQGGIEGEQGDWRLRNWTFEENGVKGAREVWVNFGALNVYEWEAPGNIVWNTRCTEA